MEYKLPPLPEPGEALSKWAYDERDMQAYAIAAIEAKGVPDGWHIKLQDQIRHLLEDCVSEETYDGLTFYAVDRTVTSSNLILALMRLFASAPPAPQAIAPELDVRNIMLAIEPGPDGFGEEVYAKSVNDVVDMLTKMGQELEEWQLGIKRLPAPQAEHLASSDPQAHQQAITDHAAEQAKPRPDPLHDDIQSVLFEVEQAIQNGCCPWQVEAAFEAYEAARRLQQPAHGIQGS